jgi:putative acyl-CoA dehydrogenase
MQLCCAVQREQPAGSRLPRSARVSLSKRQKNKEGRPAMNTTHDVFNQPDPLVDYNLFDGNRALQSALQLNAPSLDTAELSALGATLGSEAMQTHARLANAHTPELHSHDRFGRRIDQVEFHPSYHALMEVATGAGLHGTPFAASEQATEGHAHTRRAAAFMMFTETEPSASCARSP